MTTTSSEGQLALGVDGGGTKSDAVLVDESGSVLGWGRAGSAAGFYVGTEAARASCVEAVRAALAEACPRDLWVAGLSKYIFDEAGVSIPQTHFVRADEITMGLAAALETHGIVVLSGTGAFVAGIAETGARAHLDSLGPVLGDYGSGYQIGLMGMRAAMASSWTAERHTVLERLVPEQLGVDDLRGVFNLAYVQHVGRAHTASAAEAVVRAAEDGDAVARKIILQAADDISDVLADVIHRLHAEEADYALVASGGIAQGCEMYWSRLCERALEMAPNLRPVCPKIPPCVGAALIALREMGVPWSQELVSRIEETHTLTADS